MSASLSLAARLDNPAAEHLSRDLLEARGGAVLINAEAVIFCGALAMQLLVAARKQWLKDGQAFEVERPSSDLINACRLLGVTLENVGVVETLGDKS